MVTLFTGTLLSHNCPTCPPASIQLLPHPCSPLAAQNAGAAPGCGSEGAGELSYCDAPGLQAPPPAPPAAQSAGATLGCGHSSKKAGGCCHEQKRPTELVTLSNRKLLVHRCPTCLQLAALHGRLKTQVLRLAVPTHQRHLMNHITAMFLIYKRLLLPPLRF